MKIKSRLVQLQHGVCRGEEGEGMENMYVTQCYVGRSR